jgi:MAE_28990/MAE_18760-like HEPN
MSIATPSDVIDRLDGDLAWRRAELQALKAQVDSIQKGSHAAPASRMILRAGVALLYANLEGFVKDACQVYVDYIAKRRLKIGEVTDNFVMLSVRRQAVAAANGNLNALEKLVHWTSTSNPGRLELAKNELVNTKSNLSSSVLKNILDDLGIDDSYFSTKSPVLDAKLLATRNAIAHGRDRFPSPDDFDELYALVIGMIEEVKRLIEDAVVNSRYRSAKSVP